jgi:hypothetical protein
MAKVQNAKEPKKALNELYKRYEGRGMTFDRSREHLKKVKSGLDENHSKIASASKTGANPQKSKNGIPTKGFITDKEFADRFRASREYVPKANVDLETTILLQKVNKSKLDKAAIPVKSKKNDIRKKLMAEANRNNPKTPSQKKTMEGIDNARQKKISRSK